MLKLKLKAAFRLEPALRLSLFRRRRRRSGINRSASDWDVAREIEVAECRHVTT